MGRFHATSFKSYFSFMKTSSFIITLPAFVLAAAISTNFSHAQTTASPVPVSNAGQPTLQMGTYQVTERDANSQVWQRVDYETLPSGKTVPHIHKYTELATGLNHLVDGQWVPSKEEIDISPDGNSAAATNGQHQAYFPGDIAQGVIELDTPDGKRLQSRPIGLSYDDGTNSVLIAELTNSPGYLVGANQVIYPDAFTGVKADLLYVYTKARFEQDIILRAQPPTPESFGLNPQTVRLQVLTEFFNPPQPVVSANSVPTPAGNLTDDNLSFGAMAMMPGKAFLSGTNSPTVQVTKQWLLLDGRQFLVEEVPVTFIANELNTLPQPPIQTSLRTTTPKVSRNLILPPQRQARSTKEPMLMAKAALPTPGVVLDYVVVNTSTNNFTFQGDSTYYISGGVNLNGTTTIEGGAVIKYTNNASILFLAPSQLKWLGSAYCPVIFTAKDDDSVGESITNSTGNPSGYYASSAMDFWGGSATLNYVRIAYAQEAIQINNGNNLTLCNAQIVNCGEGICWDHSGGSAIVRNALFANVQNDFDFFNLVSNNTVWVQNVTFVTNGNLIVPPWYIYYPAYPTLGFTNCIFANVTTAGGWIGGANNGSYGLNWSFSGAITVSQNPFQSAGGGNYYLAVGCGFQNAGTLNIDPTLLAGLRTKTTQAPDTSYVNQTISSDTPFSPLAQRDTASPGPDLGYHYDPIDYAVSGVVVNNASVSVGPGTVIGAFGTNGSPYGLSIGTGAQLISDGTAAQPCRIVTYNTVQEGPGGGWEAPTLASVTDYIGGAGGMFDFQFTDWSMFGPANASHLIIYQSNPVNMRDCQFHGGSLVTYLGPTINLTNCLFDRVYLALYPDDTNTLVLRNNLFYGGTLDLLPFCTSHSVVQDNLFDRTTILDHNPPCTYTGYNAYVTNYNRLQPTTTYDIILTNSPAYQTGPLGAFYQPTNSPLIDAGSGTVDAAGLTGYTILTNQSPDTGTVDIGYHYSILSAPIACTTNQQICPNNPFGLCGSDPYGLPLTYIAVVRPLHGTLGYDASGNFVYTPTSGYEGQTIFTYKVNDGFMDSARDTVTLTITDTVTAYYPSPAATCKDTPVNITLKDYDSCREAPSTFSYAVLTKPTNGLLSGAAPNLTYTPTNANFTGMDSFTYKVSTGNSATNTVTIIVGDDNVSANSQTAMTGTNQPLNITLTASSLLGCTNSFSYTIVDNPTNGTLSGTGTSRTYTPTNGEGVDTFTFTVSDGVWNSPCPDAQVTIFVVAGPQLMTSCRSDRIVLNWSLDSIVQQMEDQYTDRFYIQDFKVYRSTDQGVSWQWIHTSPDPDERMYVDTDVTTNQNYCYLVTFEYSDYYTDITYPTFPPTPGKAPYSNESCASTCSVPFSGPIDVAFILDNTLSTWNNTGSEPYQNAITNALAYIESASGGNCRFAFITPDTDNDNNPINGTNDYSGHDMVDVRIGLTNNVTAFESVVMDANLRSIGGAWPESTDECLNTVVYALAAAGRQDTNNCAPLGKVLQIGDFTPAFRTNAIKLVVLITDHAPSGFCDSGGNITTSEAHQYAVEAKAQCIKINAIQIGDNSHFDPYVWPLMQDYAATSCGWYEQLSYNSSSSDIEDAILQMLFNNGECNCQ
jgi:hypothetical protein